jgi:creatinine amidohydrolase
MAGTGPDAVELGDLTWPQVEAVRSPDLVLAVPVGSTEQHGRHLALSMDSDLAVALCRGLAVRRSNVLVAPLLPYGSSGEHADFPGTLSIGQVALESVLVELGRSASATFRRIVFVSGHGGNAEPLRRAVDRLRQEGRDARGFAPSWVGDAHAGRIETSLALALDPDRVRLSEAAPGDTRPLADLLPLLRSAGVRAVSASGVLGDPGGADAVEGAALLERLVADLVSAGNAWWDQL